MDQNKDFIKVNDLRFDIVKLRSALNEVLSRKSYDDAAGTKYIAGISLNQIPGKPDSIKGENIKGIYWTNQIAQEKKVFVQKKLTNMLIQNSSMILKILILEKFTMYCLKNLN